MSCYESAAQYPLLAPQVLRGCKGYDWFCENIEPKIVRAWEVHGLCTTKCRKGSHLSLSHSLCVCVRARELVCETICIITMSVRGEYMPMKLMK
jgi:hypothetical protein